IVFIGFVGVVLGNLNKRAQIELLNNMQKILPAPLTPSSAQVLSSASHRLDGTSGFVLVLVFLLSIFLGSRLFTLLEVSFDVIYCLPPRRFLYKNALAIGMFFLFVLLAPTMVLTATGTQTLLSLVKHTPLDSISGIVFRLIGIVSSLLLFEFIYVFVPNRQIKWRWNTIHYAIRHSWYGTFVVVILLQLYLIIFPLYADHFMNGYVGELGFALILLAFFYFFVLILLIGAEINSYFAEGKSAPESDIIDRACTAYYEERLNIE
ncbi:MAG: YihY/virulence factor BrkB family protein, partial [Chloroflexota bacterium]|nr:YihY/virulence factor BrkB family protein [Chloroflexota bacterium]